MGLNARSAVEDKMYCRRGRDGAGATLRPQSEVRADSAHSSVLRRFGFRPATSKGSESDDVDRTSNGSSMDLSQCVKKD